MLKVIHQNKKLFTVLALVSAGFLNLAIFSGCNDLEIALEAPAYKQLSAEAKETVVDFYEQTGEIVLLEENHEPDSPYLNPDYLSYLELDDEEKAKVELIPEKYSFVLDDISLLFGDQKDGEGKGSVVSDLVRADFDTFDLNEDIPMSFDLRDIDGESYITPLKDQGGMGICWAFSSTEQAESFLMTENKLAYSSSTDVFSPRQMDYASSTDGINNYGNENGYRQLGEGGNFYMSSMLMANAVTLNSESSIPFDENMDKKELAEVLNYNNSEYEVDSTLMLPTFNPGYEEYFVYFTKLFAMNAGGAYVGTGSPQGACAAKNTDGTFVIDEDSDCRNNKDKYGAHAMQIIGWDDNYVYNYCKVGDLHKAVKNGSCQEGNKVTGTGAYIIRNSWGEDRDYAYVYLTYNSTNVDVNFVTGMSSMDEREWDNNYHKNVFAQDDITYGTTDSVTFNKKISGDEKIEKIKFMTLNTNGEYTVSINGNEVQAYKAFWPGIHTVDLSDKNIVVSDDDIVVTIKSTGDDSLLHYSTSVFTSNIEKTPTIKTSDFESEDDVLENGDFSFVMYSDTKNIPSGAQVSYKLIKDGVDVSDLINVANNVVAINNINATITIDSNADYGEYTLETNYDGHSFQSKIALKTSLKLDFDDTLDVFNDIVVFDGNIMETLLNLVTTNAENPSYVHYASSGDLAADDNLKTGDVLVAVLGDRVKLRYKIVVLGDINSDGAVSSADYIKVRKHIMGTEIIDGGLKFYAADMNKDETISSADYIKIRKYIMNKENN